MSVDAREAISMSVSLRSSFVMRALSSAWRSSIASGSERISNPFRRSGLNTNFFAWTSEIVLKRISRQRGMIPRFCLSPVGINYFNGLAMTSSDDSFTVTCHCVCFSRSCDSIAEEQTVTALD